MATANDVADTLLSRLGPMSAMKLEKLVYYSQAWYLAWHDEPLFGEEIQAWRQGPVVPALFHQHAGQATVYDWPSGHARNLSPQQEAAVAWVVDKYGGFTAEALSRMTHNELPWRIARAGLEQDGASTAPIDHGQMAAYYARHQADPETAVQHAVANAALEGLEFDEDFQETLRDVATGLISADDAVAAEIQRARRG